MRRGMAHVPEGRGVIAELTVEENLRLGGLWRKGARRTRRWRGSTSSSRRSTRAASAPPTRCPAVSGRCSSSAARCSPSPRCCCSTSRRSAWPRWSSTQIFDLVRDLVDRTGLAVLLVEQNAKSALSIADTGVVLNLGKVVATDDAKTLAADEQLRHAYLGF